jgi:hypothetical protein
MRTINLTDKFKSIMAKKMKSKPTVSDDEQEAYNREIGGRYKKRRYSEDMVRYKSPGQRYREMSQKQKDKAEKKSGELRKEFPSEK